MTETFDIASDEFKENNLILDEQAYRSFLINESKTLILSIKTLLYQEGNVSNFSPEIIKGLLCRLMPERCIDYNLFVLKVWGKKRVLIHIDYLARLTSQYCYETQQA